MKKLFLLLFAMISFVACEVKGPVEDETDKLKIGEEPITEDDELTEDEDLVKTQVQANKKSKE